MKISRNRWVALAEPQVSMEPSFETTVVVYSVL
jgi:hypothetical protein